MNYADCSHDGVSISFTKGIKNWYQVTVCLECLTQISKVAVTLPVVVGDK